jgi:hypothetical protein
MEPISEAFIPDILMSERLRELARAATSANHHLLIAASEDWAVPALQALRGYDAYVLALAAPRLSRRRSIMSLRAAAPVEAVAMVL